MYGLRPVQKAGPEAARLPLYRMRDRPPVDQGGQGRVAPRVSIARPYGRTVFLFWRDGSDDPRKGEGHMAEYAKPRGTADILPEEAVEWRAVEDLWHETARRYHLQEIRTPMFEHTEVFARGVGDTTDIVQKEMYTFLDRGGRSLTLRPEGTAGVVRAFVEQKLYGGPLPIKLYYTGPVFRYETPQAGRYRQHHQYGVEAIGSEDPRLDAEIVELAHHFLRAAGVETLRLEINSVGCPVCRPAHRELLRTHLEPVREKLCGDCQDRFDKNPLRILDCKIDRDNPVVRLSPAITDHLCADCQEHFSQVRAYLDALSVPYEVNKILVRGLDYYTRTTFEFMEDSIGAKSTILGGGRYNSLVRMLGGPETPGIGFGGGIERLLLARRANGVVPAGPDLVDVYVIAVGEAGRIPSVRAVQALRHAGLAADADYGARGLKAQLKAADRLAARLAVLIGDEEAAQGVVTLRDLATRDQWTVAEGELARAAEARLRSPAAVTADRISGR